jgi:hypothetical protein
MPKGGKEMSRPGVESAGGSTQSAREGSRGQENAALSTPASCQRKLCASGHWMVSTASPSRSITNRMHSFDLQDDETKPATTVHPTSPICTTSSPSRRLPLSPVKSTSQPSRPFKFATPMHGTISFDIYTPQHNLRHPHGSVLYAMPVVSVH